MAVTSKRSSTSKASSVKAPEAPKEDPRVKELEAKVAKLEASLAALANALNELKSAPAPVATGRDEGLRSELRKHFKARTNRKSADYIPNID